MQPDPALVGSDRVVELHTIADIDLYLSLVVYPRHTELDLTIRFGDPLQDRFSPVHCLIRFHNRPK